MKNLLILLTVFLLMTALPPSARASLCEQCSQKSFISSIGQCKVCADGVTSSSAFKLCKKCSAKLAQCEACQQDLKPKKEKKNSDNAEEIRPVEKKIAEMEEFATRARFTAEGLKNHQASIAALRERLKKLKGEAEPK